MTSGYKITEELEHDVIQYYLKAPITIEKCGNKFDLCKPTIAKILDKYKIPRYEKTNIYNPNLIENYFENIDSEEKAYYLGFMITDGNVFKTKHKNGQYYVSITQDEKDDYILTRFLECVGSNRQLSHDGRGCCTASIASKKMAYDLSKYGILPNKTLISELPLIDEKYMRHMIRGILDGDGSVIAHHIKNKFTGVERYLYAISFCGSRVLMNQLSDYISETLCISRKLVYTYSDRNLSEVKWVNIFEMFELGMYLYSGATIFLHHKCDIFLDFLHHYNLVSNE